MVKNILVTFLLMIMLAASIYGCGNGGYSGSNQEEIPSNNPAQEQGQTETQKQEEAAVDEATLEFRNLQAEVDQGRQSWRLDPIAVAKESATGNSYKILTNDGISRAVVEVDQGGKKIRLILYKPIKQDKTGIWALESIEE